MIPPQFRNGNKSKPENRVILHEHVIIGAHTVILPSVEIGIGTAVGPQSLVSKTLPEWSIYFGLPARKIGDRSKNLLKLKKELLDYK